QLAFEGRGYARYHLPIVRAQWFGSIFLSPLFGALIQNPIKRRRELSEQHVGVRHGVHTLAGALWTRGEIAPREPGQCGDGEEEAPVLCPGVQSTLLHRMGVTTSTRMIWPVGCSREPSANEAGLNEHDRCFS